MAPDLPGELLPDRLQQLGVPGGCQPDGLGVGGRRAAPGHTVQRLGAGGEGPDSQTREARAVLVRSEEHTSELQSRGHLVCRLLLVKKKSPERAVKEEVG